MVFPAKVILALFVRVLAIAMLLWISTFTYFYITASSKYHLHTAQPTNPLTQNIMLSIRESANKEVVALSSYYDSRQRHSHNNSTAILAAALNEIVEENAILGCEVDGVIQSRPMMMIKPILINWWIKMHHPKPYTEITVSCFDMAVHKNSMVSLIYQYEGIYYKAAVEKAVVIPSEVQVAQNNSVMVCSTGYGTPRFLDHWLLYQTTIGVTFIHLNVHVSFIQNVNKSSVLKRYIQSGYVKMIVWEEYLNKSQVFLYSQSLKYQDCMLRYHHAYKYIMIIDFDEFFIPLGIEKEVSFYADYLLEGSFFGSFHLPTIKYYCALKNFPASAVLQDGNITKLYSTTQFSVQEKGKSIHQLKVMEEASVHYATLIPPHKTKYASKDESKCYLAHIRKYPAYTNRCKTSFFYM